jgi:hypothetical protein
MNNISLIIIITFNPLGRFDLGRFSFSLSLHSSGVTFLEIDADVESVGLRTMDARLVLDVMSRLPLSFVCLSL